MERKNYMNIQITADSTCDLPQVLLDSNNISLIRLIVTKDNQEFIDNETITPADIFAHVAAGGDLCKTAALGVGTYEDAFREFSGAYDAVIHISLGSGFSSSFQNAKLAAGEFENVYVVDSQNLSTGQGLVVLKACELAKSDLDVPQILSVLNDYTEKVEASFVVENLTYLVKGGRCSSAAALGANLLNLKPCIEVKNGKMSVGKKYRGSFDKALSNYVKDRLSGRTDLDEGTIFITHTPVADSALECVRKDVCDLSSFRNIYENEAGCTISCHCGPGTLGILFVRK
jgi:DegV family protein with EDD domain